MNSETNIFEEALNMQRAGRHGAAVELFRRALSEKPQRADVHGCLGISLTALGRLDEAAAAYQTAIQIQPTLSQAYNNLSGVFQMQGKYQQALDAMNRAVALQPNSAECHFNSGNLLSEIGRRDEAVAAYQRALAIQPNIPQAWNNLGSTLNEMGRFAQAVDACKRALALDAGMTDAMNNLSNAQSALGKFAEARQILARALALRPEDALSHWNSALLRLLQGDLPAAWAEYEWRLRLPNPRKAQPNFTQPRWDGSPLNGRRIFLYAEQGFGDTIQFARYIAPIAQSGGKVILACQPELMQLLSVLEGVVRCIPLGQAPLSFDVHCPLMSLAYVQQTTLDTIPGKAPYLRADAEKSARWRERLAQLPGKKIGLVWSGRRYPDPRRSLRFDELAKALAVKETTWISLQKGPGAADAGPPLVDWTAELTDFSQTAALIDGLDMIITIDSAVAHLAGALGRPVWMLLPFAPAWRWLLNRDDSPWYPSMRLFRQKSPGDWREPLKQLTAALESRVWS